MPPAALYTYLYYKRGAQRAFNLLELKVHLHN